MNRYLQFKERKQKEFNDFPMEFAFSDKDFAEGMKKLGLLPTDTDKIYKFGELGGFYRRTDAKELHEMLDRYDAEFKEAVSKDITGEGFIFDMFDYELANHEYVITYSVDDALTTLDLTYEDIEGDIRLSTALELAKKRQCKNDKEEIFDIPFPETIGEEITQEDREIER